jgi:hypothetical protein
MQTQPSYHEGQLFVFGKALFRRLDYDILGALYYIPLLVQKFFACGPSRYSASAYKKYQQ